MDLPYDEFIRYEAYLRIEEKERKRAQKRAEAKRNHIPRGGGRRR